MKNALTRGAANSAIVAALCLLLTFAILDCYTWHLFGVHRTSTSVDSGRLKSGGRTSLSGVERSLSHARAAIRRALLHQDPDDAAATAADHDLVYTNATFFKRSYHEMAKRLRVFVYPDGEEPLVHMGPCKAIYAVEGIFIEGLELQAAAGSGYLTSDPEEAHLFFLPFSVSNMVSYLSVPNLRTKPSMRRFATDYIHLISRKYPFWNRSRGHDHFMVSCHDWAPYITSGHPELQTNAIRAVCVADPRSGYIASKDVSIPEINLIGGEIPTTFGGLPPVRRNILAFFAGGRHGPVRTTLFRYWKTEGGKGMSNSSSRIFVYEKLPPGQSYHDYMKRSRYCLCPPGYEVNSPRIVEAIYNECVPVIILAADHDYVLPFSDVLDWSSFSVRLREKDIPELERLLEVIPENHYVELQGRLSKVRQHFILNQPPQKYDAFNMVLHSAWLRRLNVVIQ